MGSWIEAQDSAVPGLIDIAEGQPLRLKLIRAILQAADDPDRDFLLQAEIGLPVGIWSRYHEPHTSSSRAKSGR